MRKTLFISLALAVAMGLVATGILYAHGRGYYAEEDVKVDIKKIIDKGIQITLSSDDPEIAKEIQEDSRYYEGILAHRDRCPHMERMAQSHHSCMW